MFAKHLIMRIFILTSVYPRFSHLELRTESRRVLILSINSVCTEPAEDHLCERNLHCQRILSAFCFIIKNRKSDVELLNSNQTRGIKYSIWWYVFSSPLPVTGVFKALSVFTSAS